MTIIEIILNFFSSSAWLRLILSGLLVTMTIQVVAKYNVPHIRGLQRIPIILIIREVLFAIFGHASLIYFSDALIMVEFFWWLEGYSGHRKTTFAFSAGILVISAAMLVFHFFFPEVLFMLALVNVFYTVVIILFYLQMLDVTMYNTDEAQFILQFRGMIFLLFISTRLAVLINPALTTSFATHVLIPLTFLPYFYYVFIYDRYYYDTRTEQEEFNATYLNSIFDFMQTIGTAMTERIEVKSVLEYVMQAIVHYTDAEAGIVLLRNADNTTLEITCREGFFPPPYEVPQMVAAKISSVESYFEGSPIQIGQTVLGEVARDGQPLYIRSTIEDGRMKSNIRDNTMFISSLIAIPLFVNNEIFGIVSVIHRNKRDLFTELDYERCKVFVEYASLTLDSLFNYTQLLEKQEIEREVNIAGEIQKKLLPGRLPKRLRTKVSAWTQPAKGVSGDYYDIITLNRQGKMAIVICDVAGKGVPASLIMVMIRTIVHLVAGSANDASKVVSWINRGIAGRIDIERFATLSYITYDPNTGLVEYSNAAHHPLVVLRKDSGKIEKIDAQGLPIGLERDAKYERKTAHLAEGDAVMLYTDGIIEAMNPSGIQYEEERLQKVFKQNANRSAGEIVSAIREDLDIFVDTARQHDDQTLIIMKA